ncbi:MAG TPA: VOC family protein [Phycisphaerales bacterium]|nr:VOC family protein [Phycisphaerales bacterium]
MYSQPFDALAHTGYGLARELPGPRPATPVVLWVADLEVARKFYFDLLGFVPAEGYGYTDNRLVLVSPLLAHGYRSIVLTRDQRGATSHGLLLELESSSELLDRYMLARLLGAATTPLLTRGRSLTVGIKDPDGNDLELCARASAREQTPVATRWGRVTGGEGSSPTRHGRGRGGGSVQEEAAGERSLDWFDAFCEADNAPARAPRTGR